MATVIEYYDTFEGFVARGSLVGGLAANLIAQSGAIVRTEMYRANN